MPADIITTVLAPATGRGHDLVDLATVKLALNVAGGDTDKYFQLLISWTSAEVKQFCNRTLVVETLKDEFWAQRDVYTAMIPGGLEPLQLSRYPVVAGSVTIVENGVTLVDGTDFRIDYATGQVARLDGNLFPTVWPVLPIAVTYSAGYDPMDPPIIDAVIRMISARWAARGRDPYLKQESVPGVGELQYWIPNNPTGNLTPDIEDILDNYRQPVIA